MSSIVQRILTRLRPPATPPEAQPTQKPIRLDFDEIYQKNIFGSDESHSGEGSELTATVKLREELPDLLRDLGVTSFLDLPCGDFNWISLIDFSGIRYIGGDVVEDLVRKNQSKHGSEQRTFQKLDLIHDDLPHCDLVFCRDCLVHLPYEDIFLAIENVRRSGATWLATTTFVGREPNSDLFGYWRPLNLEAAPFNFPKPTRVLVEGCPPIGGLDFSDKSMGFWRVEDIPTRSEVQGSPA